MRCAPCTRLCAHLCVLSSCESVWGQSVVSLCCVCESMDSFVSKSMACHFTFVLGFDSVGDTCKTAVIRRGCDLRVPHALGVFVCT